MHQVVKWGFGAAICAGIGAVTSMDVQTTRKF